jgi:integrase
VRARRDQIDPAGFVFATSTGRELSADNLRSRTLKRSVERANKNLAKANLAPLPQGLTPHSLRRTFVSVLDALGEDPGVVMHEMATRTRSRAARLPAAMRRELEEKDALRALLEGADWVHTGTRTNSGRSSRARRKVSRPS